MKKWHNYWTQEYIFVIYWLIYFGYDDIFGKQYYVKYEMKYEKEIGYKKCIFCPPSLVFWYFCANDYELEPNVHTQMLIR